MAILPLANFFKWSCFSYFFVFPPGDAKNNHPVVEEEEYVQEEPSGTVQIYPNIQRHFKWNFR